jgi:acetyl-CoA decarbonylase/synthase complex subunit beta
MFADLPTDVGVIYEGERIRKSQMQVEFGGPFAKYKFELARVKPADVIEDGKITVIGPDIKDFEVGTQGAPFGILIDVSGKELESLFEGVIERRIHEYCNYVEGFMHLNQRYDIWCRVSQKAFGQGLDSLVYLGKAIDRLYKADLPLIEKIQITFYTDPEKTKEMFGEAMMAYEERDAKARGLSDEDVDVFYGCQLCQSFAPTHCCVITPQRYANCGSISWFDGRAAARVDPKGSIFEIQKGETIDSDAGEYAGASSAVSERTLGEINKIQLYTAFGTPHTSCGCFEGIAFYIPEVDGLGCVLRGYLQPTVNGLPFSVMAESTSGGRQVDGFHGISIEYMRSPKFLRKDGGWNRIVWLPSDLKERVKDFIPKDVVDKIATENEAKTVDELTEYLKAVNHPVVQRWKAEPTESPVEVAPVTVAAAQSRMPTAVPTSMISTTQFAGLPAGAGGIKIILQGVKINAEKIIIKKVED